MAYTAESSASTGSLREGLGMAAMILRRAERTSTRRGQRLQVHHLRGLDPARLDQHPDLLPHPLAVEEVHRLAADLGVRAADLVEQAAGGQEERLARERHRGQARLLAGADQGREVDVGGQVLAPDVGERIAVRAVPPIAAERAVKADAAVEQARLLEPVVAGDQEAAVEPARELAVERAPDGREGGELAGRELGVGAV